MIHSLSDVQSSNIGIETSIWQFVVILKNARIGQRCNINAHVFIENDVIIGNDVTVKSGVQLWDGIRISDGVFIGPNVTFTNDLKPRSKKYPTEFPITYVRTGASIGANATILPGLEIGEKSMIGAGTVVVKNVPNRALIIGNPGRRIAWINEDGTRMIEERGFWIDSDGRSWIEENGQLHETI